MNEDLKAKNETLQQKIESKDEQKKITEASAEEKQKLKNDIEIMESAINKLEDAKTEKNLVFDLQTMKSENDDLRTHAQMTQDEKEQIRAEYDERIKKLEDPEKERKRKGELFIRAGEAQILTVFLSIFPDFPRIWLKWLFSFDFH